MKKQQILLELNHHDLHSDLFGGIVIVDAKLDALWGQRGKICSLSSLTDAEALTLWREYLEGWGIPYELVMEIL